MKAQILGGTYEILEPEYMHLVKRLIEEEEQQEETIKLMKNIKNDDGENSPVAFGRPDGAPQDGE